MTSDMGFVDIAELSLSGENFRNKDWLSKSDPFVVFFLRPVACDRTALAELRNFQQVCTAHPPTNGPDRTSFAPNWHYMAETEVVWNTLSPSFVTKFRIPWALRARFTARFEVYDMDAHDAPLTKQDFLGALEVPLHAITAVRNSLYTLCDKRGRVRPAFGELRICVDRYAFAAVPRQLTLRVVFSPGAGIPAGTQIFFVISRGAPLSLDSTDGARMPGWEHLHRSGALTAPADRREWTFQDASLREDAITAGDPDRLLKLELFLHRSNGAHLRICATPTFSLRTLRSGELSDQQRVVPDSTSGANLRSADFSVNSAIVQSPILRPINKPDNFPLAALRLHSSGSLLGAGSLQDSRSNGSVGAEPEVVFRFGHFFWWPGAKRDSLLRTLSSKGTVR